MYTIDDNIKYGVMEKAAELTDRVFDGSFHTAKDGDLYYMELDEIYIVDDETRYRIRYQFPVVKGDEPALDELDYDNNDYIESVESI